MQCLFCGKTLGFLKSRRNGGFCSEEHRTLHSLRSSEVFRGPAPVDPAEGDGPPLAGEQPLSDPQPADFPSAASGVFLPLGASACRTALACLSIPAFIPNVILSALEPAGARPVVPVVRWERSAHPVTPARVPAARVELPSPPVQPAVLVPPAPLVPPVPLVPPQVVAPLGVVRRQNVPEPLPLPAALAQWTLPSPAAAAPPDEPVPALCGYGRLTLVAVDVAGKLRWRGAPQASESPAWALALPEIESEAPRAGIKVPSRFSAMPPARPHPAAAADPMARALALPAAKCLMPETVLAEPTLETVALSAVCGSGRALVAARREASPCVASPPAWKRAVVLPASRRGGATGRMAAPLLPPSPLECEVMGALGKPVLIPRPLEFRRLHA